MVGRGHLRELSKNALGFYEKLVYSIENVLQYNNINNSERQQQR